tara:strand:- start:512 stop:736 length:225 start_codon:yes stop_codon:yes gene_type:complete
MTKFKDRIPEVHRLDLAFRIAGIQTSYGTTSLVYTVFKFIEANPDARISEIEKIKLDWEKEKAPPSETEGLIEQ